MKFLIVEPSPLPILIPFGPKYSPHDPILDVGIPYEITVYGRVSLIIHESSTWKLCLTSRSRYKIKVNPYVRGYKSIFSIIGYFHRM